MFLISFSENLLFSLPARQRRKIKQKKEEKRNEREALWRNREKYMHFGCVDARYVQDWAPVFAFTGEEIHTQVSAFDQTRLEPFQFKINLVRCFGVYIQKQGIHTPIRNKEIMQTRVRKRLQQDLYGGFTYCKNLMFVQPVWPFWSLIAFSNTGL